MAGAIMPVAIVVLEYFYQKWCCHVAIEAMLPDSTCMESLPSTEVARASDVTHLQKVEPCVVHLMRSQESFLTGA